MDEDENELADLRDIISGKYTILIDRTGYSDGEDCHDILEMRIIPIH